MSKRSRSRGAMLPLLGLVLAGVMIGALLLGVTLERVVARADCQHAADAAALAGAAEGHDVAARLASANGASLVGFQTTGLAVAVELTCDDVRAKANAERRLVLTTAD
ncbi:MAG: hypothetical protein R2706_06905 [Acidimicrobiales bacterium]